MANNPQAQPLRRCATVVAALSWILLTGGAWASAAGDVQSSFNPTAASRIWLDGSSTLHPYSSKATKLEVKVGFDPATQATAADAKTALLAGGLKSLIVSVPVEGLESGDASLDKRLQKTLKPEVAPIIRFTLGSYESEAAGDVVTVKAHGKLAIAGVEKDAGLTATCTFGPAGIHVTGTTDVLMTDFGIKPPTMMLGAIKTADKVVVHFDIELQAN